MSALRNQRRQNKRFRSRVIKSATKYDVEGCDVCGHQPMGRETYLIGEIGSRMVGVCNQHLRHLDSVVSLQFYMEGEENIRQRELAAGASTDG